MSLYCTRLLLFLTENKAARIILLIKIKGVFACIMAVYGIKDSVSTCNQWKARAGSCVQEKHSTKIGIHVSYFWSGYIII